MPKTRGTARKAEEKREVAQALATSRRRPSDLPPQALRMLVSMLVTDRHFDTCCQYTNVRLLIKPLEHASDLFDCIDHLRSNGRYHTCSLDQLETSALEDGYKPYELPPMFACHRISKLARAAHDELSRLSLSCDLLHSTPPPCALTISPLSRRFFDAVMSPALERRRARAAATTSPSAPL